MGGLGSVLAVGDRSLSVLTCLFATADLTTKMLRGGAACLSPSSWRLFPPDSVWWQEHVVDDAAPSSPAPSLAGAFEQMSHMLIYRQSIVENNNTLSMDRIKAFELALQPSYSPFTFSDLDGSDVPSNSEMVSHHAFLRAYQHTALVYLYRAVCGLPAGHPQVQQHINACLDAIDAVPRKSKILNCLVFPLCVAGAHLRAAQRQRRVLGILLAIQNQLKFTSLKQIAEFLESCWRKEPGNSSWLDTFATLNVNVISF
ncbi:hypothetical protein BU24DRAFT_423476 [Aaosphaeria arxii CBS 175.79]|uniref:Fungal-specific transcription factor domain-containing protein n=1 Tax=Aaosphaeria arxii CBS 175.79 TaxID=1450172 RepID=A0A6A5XMV3_9PLEO|nr:uncharacterized protein BU24DRAFT_423476 [Aaosphaeria arxii CBS 175.79]KAF2014558.1 hypothetical protein BU24DRAFT_423476 [Aaosphaeria arxii CBS 175.79]